MAGLVKRKKVYYLKWRIGKKIKRKSLGTTSRQIARGKLRQFESDQIRGKNNPLPTKTKLSEILQRYTEHVKAVKTAQSAQPRHSTYLRQVFGPVCPGLRITSRKPSKKAMKRPRTIEVKWHKHTPLTGLILIFPSEFYLYFSCITCDSLIPLRLVYYDEHFCGQFRISKEIVTEHWARKGPRGSWLRRHYRP